MFDILNTLETVWRVLRILGRSGGDWGVSHCFISILSNSNQISEIASRFCLKFIFGIKNINLFLSAIKIFRNNKSLKAQKKELKFSPDVILKNLVTEL